MRHNSMEILYVYPALARVSKGERALRPKRPKSRKACLNKDDSEAFRQLPTCFTNPIKAFIVDAVREYREVASVSASLKH